MTKLRYVKGNIVNIVGGKTKVYANEIEISSNKNIIYNAPKHSYGEPEDPPKKVSKTRVKEIELLTPLDDGSKNDKSGGLQKGFVFDKTYEFKVKSYSNGAPVATSLIKWLIKYHSPAQNKWIETPLNVKGDNVKITLNEKEMCGRFVSVRAYIDDPGTEGVLKIWKHNRFRWFDRKQLTEEINERKTKPWLANQKSTPLCGMAAIMYLLAKKDFSSYQKFILELFRKGVAKVNDYTVDVSNSEHLLKVNPLINNLYPRDIDGIMPYCDWIPFSSIRNQENKVRDYDGTDDWEFDGATLPNEIMKLMKDVLNFKTIKDNTNLISNKGTLVWDGEDSSSREVARMEELHLAGYSVVMLINTKMLKRRKEIINGKVIVKTGVISGIIDPVEHWIVFEGTIGGTISWDEYDFKVFTWGEIRNVIINPEVFSSNFYGYVYGK